MNGLHQQQMMHLQLTSQPQGMQTVPFAEELIHGQQPQPLTYLPADMVAQVRVKVSFFLLAVLTHSNSKRAHRGSKEDPKRIQSDT